MGLLRMAVISVGSLGFIGVVGAATGGGTIPVPTTTPQVLAETAAPTATPVPATPTHTATPIPTPAPTAVPAPVATKAPAPAPVATQSKCDPNYSGCVPIASDVDCAGGSGNGPAYVRGPVEVIGSDIYGLDRDGNGLACE